LVASVLDGAFETPPWSSFLTQLRELTGADFATLMLRPPGRPYGEALSLFSGEGSQQSVDDVWTRYNASLDILSDFGMEEGRIYAFDELYPPKNLAHMAYFKEVIVANGITVCRMIRLMEPSGVSGWLAISRRQDDFGPDDDALLKVIAPILRGGLRYYVALEHERFISTVTGDAMRGLHFGWMALDAQSNVIECDPEAAKVLTRSNVLSKSLSGRLIVQSDQLRDKVFNAIAELVKNPQAKPRAFTLNQDPWLDMLLMPTRENQRSVNPRAAIIAYIHGDNWHASDRCEHLVQLFGLSRSESRLALALSRGMTFSQAAESLGIKIDTARKCSKLIYSKTGAGGLPDLVRIVMRSVVAFAPRD
jgi:DNA-binding CsgD family transcriptional regulator